MYLIKNGLGSPEHPNWGSWGGRYELYRPHTRIFYHEPEERKIWTNAADWVEVNGTVYIDNTATIWRWRNHFQNDFAARMDWTIRDYKDANHPPVAKLNHANEMEVKSGEEINLDASLSEDPDGDKLNYEWIFYREAGTYPSMIELDNKNKSELKLTAPQVDSPKQLHFVVAATDDGEPKLTCYQRIIITVKP